MPQSTPSIPHRTKSPSLFVALAMFVVAGLSGPGALAQEAAPPAQSGLQAPETITLTGDDVERFIAAMTELRPLGLQLAGSIGSDPSGMVQMMAAMQANSEALEILSKHGFDSVSFQTTGYSIMMAYAAGTAQDSGVDITSIRGLLGLMQGQVSAEQYRMLEQQLLSAEQAIKNQPPENVGLVRSYRSQIEAIAY